MKIALLISGRATRYEVCLLEVLKNTKHDIDIFMVINDEENTYYKIMQDTLKQWLKVIEFKKYSLPNEFCDILDQESDQAWTMFQKIGSKLLPHNLMSLFANDKNVYDNAVKYSEDNNIIYDCYMKFRTDILPECMCIPDNIPLSNDKLYFTRPYYRIFTTHGKHKGLSLSDDMWVWGTKDMMKKWTGIYEYIINMNKESNGSYYIAHETSFTDFIYDSQIPYEKVYELRYYLDIHRKMNITDGSYNFIPFNSDGCMAHDS